jgi:hypothetical protein
LLKYLAPIGEDDEDDSDNIPLIPGSNQTPPTPQVQIDNNRNNSYFNSYLPYILITGAVIGASVTVYY